MMFEAEPVRGVRPPLGVRLERSGPVRYFDDAGLDMEVSDYVVVEEAGEQRVGRVVIVPGQLLLNQLKQTLSPITRKATEEDLKRSDSQGPRP